MEPSNAHRIQIYSWEGDGFQPCVSYGDWLVALMNWEARFDKDQVGAIERHNETDEVFVLTHGRSILFVHDGEKIQVEDMRPGVIYNVPRGTWHSVVGTRDASWLIVESNTTTRENSAYRRLDEEELQALAAQYPDWLR